MASEWIRTYGSTVEEAVANALKELQATRDEVEVVVERSPREGFLGLWRWQAEVRVRKLSPQELAARREPAEAAAGGDGKDGNADSSGPPPGARPGTIMVHGGRVYVSPSPDDKDELVIRPGDNAEVRVNGRLLDGPHIVHPDDVIEIRALDRLPETIVSVQISDDEYTASMAVDARPGVKYQIINSPPGKTVTVRAEPAGSLPPQPPSVEELEAALAEAGVVFGISREALENVVRTVAENPAAAKEPQPVAFGIPAVPTEDERVELFFDPAVRVRAEIDEERADLLGLFKLSSVAEGDVLAVVHPGKKGTPGRTVTGRDVQVTDPKPASLKVGAGAEWLEDGRTVAATRGGRPTYIRNTIAVHPEHRVAGDVDPATGHVEFDGDVTVTGSVNDSMRVVSRGTVSVGSAVTGAFVEAGEGVAIGRGIVGATVIAGARYARLFQLMGYLQPLAVDLQELVKTAARRKSAAASAGSGGPPGPAGAPAPEALSERSGAYIRELLDHEFAGMAKRVRELYDTVTQGDLQGFEEGALDPDVMQLTEGLYDLVTSTGPLTRDQIADLVRFKQQLDALIQEFHDQPKELFDVSAGFVHNARVLAAGRIVLRTGGCAYSRLWAGSGASIEAGVFRGSTLTVHAGNVAIREAGSRAGAPARIEIVTEGVFRAGLVHPGVTVTIGSRSHTFRTETSDVRVRLVDGELRVLSAGARLSTS